MFNTLQDERHISIAAQLPDNSKAHNNFLFFVPWYLLTCVYSTDAAASAELTCAPKLEMQFEWRQGKKIFESFHNGSSQAPDWISLRGVPHMENSPCHHFSSMHCHLSDKTTYCVLPHTIMLVANLPWNFIPNAKRWLFSRVWVIPCFTPFASSFCWCLF